MIDAKVVIILVTRKLFATFLFILRQFGMRWGAVNLSPVVGQFAIRDLSPPDALAGMVPRLPKRGLSPLIFYARSP